MNRGTSPSLHRLSPFHFHFSFSLSPNLHVTYSFFSPCVFSVSFPVLLLIPCSPSHSLFSFTLFSFLLLFILVAPCSPSHPVFSFSSRVLLFVTFLLVAPCSPSHSLFLHYFPFLLLTPCSHFLFPFLLKVHCSLSLLYVSSKLPFLRFTYFFSLLPSILFPVSLFSSSHSLSSPLAPFCHSHSVYFTVFHSLFACQHPFLLLSFLVFTSSLLLILFLSHSSRSVYSTNGFFSSSN
jgi:hypothetical protein